MRQVTIAAGSKIAADAGAAIANQGGNAVDAALAAALVSMGTDLGVMAPGASGFVTVWPPLGPPVVIDAYAEIPGRGIDPEQFSQSSQEVFFDYGGRTSNIVGYGSVATPGIFAGLDMASTDYGALPWAAVVAPACQWAEQGFPLTGGAAEYLACTHEAIFSWQAESYQALHHSDGRCLSAGEIVHLPGLAHSLQQIAKGGASTFYTGELGAKIAAEIEDHGGLITAEDLAAYRALVRSPIQIRFGEWEIATNPAPAIGGAALAAMLLLHEHYPLERWHGEAVRQVAQIQNAVLEYRSDHLDGAIDNAAEISNLLDLAHRGDGCGSLNSPSTIHISAVDSDGLACSISASAGYGSGVMVPGTGLWLNNSLGEIDLHPQGIASFPPGTRLASNMAPTIARHRDGTVLAIGSPGASRIATAIAQVLINFMQLNMPLAEAIAHPRLHVEDYAGRRTIAYEAGLPMDAIAGFYTRRFPTQGMYFGGVQAALWSPETGLSAAADARRGGQVAQGESY
ncbi:gamma-glutamyltransferase [Nodosilinea sp. LEGE 07088]|uniref:gamma-glutamyltransferase n=1 Tax=Nodosilinea sp. LEGE 07088 TaxID=2777968 RepID=UPI0018827787|nr:gamma-glutamyltransferase [Nodosilinea sp. LEGE 07088]MBE9140294.1 gamma-glutamyltransferase [Nodosilinea sp. LEGE 07088]